MVFPLVPAIVLALLSFLSSLFVILRIVIPVLPPHPFSSRAPPKEFALPSFKTLSAADKAHLWLAAVDVVAVAFLLAQSLAEYLSASTLGINFDVSASAGVSTSLWVSTTLRQTCLLIISSITFFQVRRAKAVSFGSYQWKLWAPLALFLVISIPITSTFAADLHDSSIFIGIITYSTLITILNTVSFSGLVLTLRSIRKNLRRGKMSTETGDMWPETIIKRGIGAVLEGKDGRPSFATEDIDALKDGSSWITSHASSHLRTVSAFSFSTTNSAYGGQAASSESHLPQHPALASYPSIPPKSSFWFSPITGERGGSSPVPPVPALPSPYRSTPPTSATASGGAEYGTSATSEGRPQFPRELGSQESWLSEPEGTVTTLSAWSYPTTRHDSIAHGPLSPSAANLLSSEPTGLTSTANLRLPSPNNLGLGLGSARVLGGYGHSPEPVGLSNAEKGVVDYHFAQVQQEGMRGFGEDVDFSHIIGWVLFIWIPLIFSLPYLFQGTLTNDQFNTISTVFFILSITLSSPLLAINIVMDSSLPIPHSSALITGTGSSSGFGSRRMFRPSALLLPHSRMPSSDPRAFTPTTAVGTIPDNMPYQDQDQDHLDIPNPTHDQDNFTQGHKKSSFSFNLNFTGSRPHSRATTMTLSVEPRRSGDVWIAKGDAVDGRSKIKRALSLLVPSPSLSVLPLHSTNGNYSEDEGYYSGSGDGRDGLEKMVVVKDGNGNGSSPVTGTFASRQSHRFGEFGRVEFDQLVASTFNPTLRMAGEQQRHFTFESQSVSPASAVSTGRSEEMLAAGQDYIVPGTPTIPEGVMERKGPMAEMRSRQHKRMSSVHGVDAYTTGVASSANPHRRSTGHLRSRSTSSIPKSPSSKSPRSSLKSASVSIKSAVPVNPNTSAEQSYSSTRSHLPPPPPPTTPLPPTPPETRPGTPAAGYFSLQNIGGAEDLDALTSAMMSLPLLVPAVKDKSSGGANGNGNGTKALSVRKKESPASIRGSVVRDSVVLQARVRGESESPKEESFGEPVGYSTPVGSFNGKGQHKHYFSLPGFELSNDNLHAPRAWNANANEDVPAHLKAVTEEDEPPRSPISPNLPKEDHRTSATIPAGLFRNRASAAASTTTLSSFDRSIGPVAFSTPHNAKHDNPHNNNKRHKRESSTTLPPLPKPTRSSIVYYKSDTGNQRDSATIQIRRSSQNSENEVPVIGSLKRASVVGGKSTIPLRMQIGTSSPAAATGKSTGGTGAGPTGRKTSKKPSLRNKGPRGYFIGNDGSEIQDFELEFEVPDAPVDVSPAGTPPVLRALSRSQGVAGRGGLKPLQLLQDRSNAGGSNPVVQVTNGNGEPVKDSEVVVSILRGLSIGKGKKHTRASSSVSGVEPVQGNVRSRFSRIRIQ